MNKWTLHDWTITKSLDVKFVMLYIIQLVSYANNSILVPFMIYNPNLHNLFFILFPLWNPQNMMQWHSK